ncbi:hypothetical protein J2S02_004806 [Metabacillus niabensis]|uniref:Uncharacterized protein n=1 Tax=Metabacillus niabensis TaxID=324854 RepID=A0ABT9Z9Y3_9BACI|nr:hypothetical protein [Metabacillus niabensis]
MVIFDLLKTILCFGFAVVVLSVTIYWTMYHLIGKKYVDDDTKLQVLNVLCKALSFVFAVLLISSNTSFV